jgi:hypothetical protein
MQSIIHANHAHKDTSIIQSPQDVNAPSLVQHQDQSTQSITNANAQPMKKEIKEFGTKELKGAIAHQTFHYGTVDIASYVQLELNMILKKDNAITAHKDS